MKDPMHIDRDEFQNHVKQEELDRKMLNDRLAEGNNRMATIETDLRPLKNLYHAVVGASILGTALITLVLFIYQNDREVIKLVGEAVQKQGIVLERMMIRHEELEKDTQKEFLRIEKALEKSGKL